MSSQSQSSSSMSRNASQANCLDPLDALIDFSEYEQVSYQSPSISPSTSSKPQFVRPVASTPTANNALLSSGQPTLSGPSHPYELHKQQTGIPAGGLATTLAINSQVGMGGFGYMSGPTPTDDFDFNTPRQASFGGVDIDMKFESEFESPVTEPAFFYPEHQGSSMGFVNPNAIGGQENQIMAPTVLPTQSNNVGRLWPGMHQQQAALAKAQQQQKQQQQLIQQQRQNSVAQQQPKAHSRSKAPQTADPIVEEKISQLLNSMRQSSVATSESEDVTPSNSSAFAQAQRLRKDEEDMDEDERLLASEEGKKLSSKERRQLRNKVSARAFRSRRKEYICQLEGEIAAKVNENSDLRAQNRALVEENTRLSDLTRMLLSSPSFSGFLDNLTTTPTPAAPQPQATSSTPAEQHPAENRQIRKDINPYATQQMQNQQVNFAMLPEQTMDFSMLDLNSDGSYVFQPQVFAVLEMPETAIDTSVLTGKTSISVGEKFESEEEKIELPAVKCIPTLDKITLPEPVPKVDEAFDSDAAFALFTDAMPAESELQEDPDFTPIFGGIEPEKALARYNLLHAEEDEVAATKAMARFQRICTSLEAVTARLEAMTVDL